MTNIPFSFIKKKYASVAAATAASSAIQGVVIFDKKNKVICVDGDVYGGNIQDVNYSQETNKLVITKADGTIQTLDFSDVASASSTMAIFGQLRDTIGITDTVQQVQGHYTDTNYLQGAQTLIAADKTLDTQIHNVQGNLEALQGTLADVAFTGKAEDVEIDPVTYGDITLQGIDGNTAENVQDALGGILRGIIDQEQVTEAAFEAIQRAVGLNNSLQFVLHTGAHYIQGATNVDDALTALDNAIQGACVAGDVTVSERGTAVQGYFKSYDIYQGDPNVPSNLKGTINIPKDFLVKSASIINVVEHDGQYYNEDDTSYEHPLPVYDTGKYIDFVINTKDTVQGSEQVEHLYLPVNELVDVYTAQGNASQIQLNIDTHNEISASIVQGSVDHWALQDGAVQTSKIATQGVTSEKIAAQGVQGWNIAQGAITADKLADDVVSIPQTTPEIIINNDTQGYDGTTIATIAGTDIKVTAGMYWAEWSDDEPSGN